MQKYRKNRDFLKCVKVSTATTLMQIKASGFSVYASDYMCVHQCTEKIVPIIMFPTLDTR